MEGWPCTRESFSEFDRQSRNFQHSRFLVSTLGMLPPGTDKELERKIGMWKRSCPREKEGFEREERSIPRARGKEGNKRRVILCGYIAFSLHFALLPRILHLLFLLPFPNPSLSLYNPNPAPRPPRPLRSDQAPRKGLGISGKCWRMKGLGSDNEGDECGK